MTNVLEQLRGGLVVSVQAWAGSAIDDPAVIAAISAAAQANGAVGVRVQGVANLRAVRARVGVPIIGLIKREYRGYEPYITPTRDEVRAIAAEGAEVVAYDATARARPGETTTQMLVDAIHSAGRLAMADCATAEDALCAQSEGADIVATTLHGYTPGTQGASLPALDLVHRLSELETFVICEGGIHVPEQAGAAFSAGADAVVVGTAITNIDWLVRGFAAQAPKKEHR